MGETQQLRSGTEGDFHSHHDKKKKKKGKKKKKRKHRKIKIETDDNHYNKNSSLLDDFEIKREPEGDFDSMMGFSQTMELSEPENLSQAKEIVDVSQGSQILNVIKKEEGIPHTEDFGSVDNSTLFEHDVEFSDYDDSIGKRSKIDELDDRGYSLESKKNQNSGDTLGNTDLDNASTELNGENSFKKSHMGQNVIDKIAAEFESKKFKNGSGKGKRKRRRAFKYDVESDDDDHSLMKAIALSKEHSLLVGNLQSTPEDLSVFCARGTYDKNWFWPRSQLHDRKRRLDEIYEDDFASDENESWEDWRDESMVVSLKKGNRIDQPPKILETDHNFSDLAPSSTATLDTTTTTSTSTNTTVTATTSTTTSTTTPANTTSFGKTNLPSPLAASSTSTPLPFLSSDVNFSPASPTSSLFSCVSSNLKNSYTKELQLTPASELELEIARLAKGFCKDLGVKAEDLPIRAIGKEVYNDYFEILDHMFHLDKRRHIRKGQVFKASPPRFKKMYRKEEHILGWKDLYASGAHLGISAEVMNRASARMESIKEPILKYNDIFGGTEAIDVDDLFYEDGRPVIPRKGKGEDLVENSPENSENI